MSEGTDLTFEQVLKFTDADLAANRAGVLTHDQHRHILLYLPSEALPSTIVMGVVFTIGFFYLILWTTTQLSYLLFCGVGMFISWVLVVFFWRRRVASLKNVSVQQLCGRVGLEFQQGRFTRWLVKIDGEAFDVEPELFALLERGGHYCLYYVEVFERRILLSVEPIDD